MVSYVRPGVYVEESLRTRNPEAASTASTAIFVAAHGRGPAEPHLVRSWSDFTKVFGGFPSATSLLPYAVFQFFNNGGRDAHVVRVLGDSPAASTLNFNDRDEVAAEETLIVNAVNEGVWGNSIYIGITDAGADRFHLTVFFGGVTKQHIVERFTDLTMDPESGRYVESVVNSVVTGSSYITAHDTNSANLATLGFAGVRPVVNETPEQLSGGDNGAVPVEADFTATLPMLESLNRSYVLNFPGVSDVAVINAALSHVEETGRGFVVIDSPSGQTPAQVVAHADTLSGSSHGAIFYPYLQVADPGAGSQGATKLVPPGGSVCGIIAATDSSRGVWKAPAGLSARVSGAVSTETRLTNDDLETLNENHVNAIRHAPGAGFVVWGSRTRKRAQADKYVPIRRTLVHLKQTLETSTEWAVFEPNDEVLWSTLQASIEGYLTGFWQQGGLRGASPEEAFYVKVDSDLNTASSIDAGIVHIEVGVALQYPAEFIVIKLSQWEGGASTLDSATA